MLVGCRTYGASMGPRPPLLPEQMEQHKGKMTLVLDLDKTLILCGPSWGADFGIFHDGMNMGVRKRPMVDKFLDTVSKSMEVVLFTATPSSYADQVVARLDPEGRIFAHRLYRKDCILRWEDQYQQEVPLKDLSILGRDLKRVVLVDDNPEYICNPGNGIVIRRFWPGDSTDNALLELLPFLVALSQLNDVRPVVAKWACNPRRAMVNEEGVLLVRDADDSPWHIVTDKLDEEEEFKEEKGITFRKMEGNSKLVMFDL